MPSTAHLRDAVADKALSLLPKADVKQLQKEGYTFDTVEEGFSQPRASPLHNTIRKRIVDEAQPATQHTLPCVR